MGRARSMQLHQPKSQSSYKKNKQKQGVGAVTRKRREKTESQSSYKKRREKQRVNAVSRFFGQVRNSLGRLIKCQLTFKTSL
jgi:hypothetical protein